VVIIEPDSLLHCVSQKNRDLVQERLALLQWTVDAFSKGCHNTATYLDGADAYYQGPSTMAPLLNEAGVGIASGFFVNASQFTSTAYCQGWATATNAILGGWGIEPRQVVIDVSRNGMGRPPQTYIDAHSATWWCNPPAKLGTSPTMTGLVRLKAPGESDGLAGIVTGVPSGAFDPRLAMALINGAVTA
jgi:endoglucanase